MGFCCCKMKKNENVEEPKNIGVSKGFFSSWKNRKRNERSYEILLLGLEGVGKTTIGYWAMKMKTPKSDYPPTVGVQKFKIKFSNSIMKLTEIGGGENIRKIWHHYFVKAIGCIFVIDVSELSKIASSVEVLCNIMRNKFMIRKPFLILLTKSGINTIDECDLNEAFDLENIANNLETPVFISIVTFDNHILLFQSLIWLKNYIDSEYSLLNERILNDIYLNEKLKEHAKWVINNQKIVTLDNYRENRRQYEQNFFNSITAQMDKNFINFNRRPISAPVNIKKALKTEQCRPSTTKSLDKNFKRNNKVYPLKVNDNYIEMETIENNKNNDDDNNKKITGTKRKIINNQIKKNKQTSSSSLSSINTIQYLSNSQTQIQSISGKKFVNIDNPVYDNSSNIKNMINDNDQYNSIYNNPQIYESESTDEQFNPFDLLQVKADIHCDATLPTPTSNDIDNQSTEIIDNKKNNINNMNDKKIIKEPIYMNIKPPISPIKSRRLIKSAGHYQPYKVENWLNDNYRYLIVKRSREIGISNNIINILNKRKLIEKKRMEKKIIKDTSTNIEHLVLHGEEAKTRRLAIEQERIYEQISEPEEIDNKKQSFTPPLPPELKNNPE